MFDNSLGSSQSRRKPEVPSPPFKIRNKLSHRLLAGTIASTKAQLMYEDKITHGEPKPTIARHFDAVELAALHAELNKVCGEYRAQDQILTARELNRRAAEIIAKAVVRTRNLKCVK